MFIHYLFPGCSTKLVELALISYLSFFRKFRNFFQIQNSHQMGLVVCVHAERDAPRGLAQLCLHKLGIGFLSTRSGPNLENQLSFTLYR